MNHTRQVSSFGLELLKFNTQDIMSCLSIFTTKLLTSRINSSKFLSKFLSLGISSRKFDVPSRDRWFLLMLSRVLKVLGAEHGMTLPKTSRVVPWSHCLQSCFHLNTRLMGSAIPLTLSLLRSLYCLSYSSYDISLENLVLDQPIIP